MHISAGTILQSLPSMDGSNFEKAVIFITESNEKGATGFVVNKPFPRRLNELEEFRNSRAFPLYEGGPVDQGHVFFIHRRPDLIEGGTPVSGNVFFGGNFKQAVSCINNRFITESDLKIFIGYCGWDDTQLQEEIAEGTWLAEGDPDSIFS